MRALVMTAWPDAPADPRQAWGVAPACTLPIAGIPAIAALIATLQDAGVDEVLVCTEDAASVRAALAGVTGWRMAYPAPGGAVDVVHRLPSDADLLCISAAAWFSSLDLQRLLEAGPDSRLVDARTERCAWYVRARTLAQTTAATLRQLQPSRSIPARQRVDDITTMAGHRRAWEARLPGGIVIADDAVVPASVRAAMQEPIFIGPGVHIAEDAVLVGPVEVGAGGCIGAGCRIAGAIVGPHTAVGSGQELSAVVADGALLWSAERDHTVRIEEASMLASRPARARSADHLERALEASLAALGLLLIAPILLLSAGLIKLTSSGPVLYQSRRTVRPPRSLIRSDAYLHDAGQTVPYPVLRTMRVGADRAGASERGENVYGEGPFHKYEDDQRVTKIGHLLRKTSIDELPLLWEVVRGNLRLVGVWALPSAEAALLDESTFSLADRDLADTARLRFGGQVGLGGLWQSQGRSRLSAESRALYDAWQVVTIHHRGAEPLPDDFAREHTTTRRGKLVIDTVLGAALGRGAM